MDNVISMSSMFSGATVFNEIIELKPMRELRTVEGIFIGANAFNKDWKWDKFVRHRDREVRRDILEQVRER
jgi:hypothetical protein